MNKVKKCRHTSPSLLDRLIIWFGGMPVLHDWMLYRRQNGHTIYYCRKCECGANEIQNAGPMGDGKWQDINKPFKSKWERDSFNKAEILGA